MNLTKRFIKYNAAIFVVPLVITLIFAFVFSSVGRVLWDTETNYHSAKNLLDLHYEFFTADGSFFKEHPERLLTKEYQQFLNEKFSSTDTNFAIIKNSSIAYSTKPLTMIEIQKCTALRQKSVFTSTVTLDDGSYLVRFVPLTFEDGSTGDFLMLGKVGKDTFTAYSLFYFSAIIYILTLILTNWFFAARLSRKVTRPLKHLELAANGIASGNLEEIIFDGGDEEIKSLSHSFEKMRIQLKDSIILQQKLDDNRKVLVSSISHDLKTPITSIKGYIEGIFDGVAQTEEKRNKYLHTIYQKAGQIDAMVDDLLLYSKLDLNQLPYNFQKTDICKYLEDCVIEINLEPALSEISLELFSELTSAKYVMLDIEKIHRVIINIIDNSRKYMDKTEGIISIFLRENTSNVIIEVRDNGRGIDRNQLSQVFDRFYRVDKARTNVAGSGLGLAISKQIVEDHAGNIWVKSTLGVGTSIFIALPSIN